MLSALADCVGGVVVVQKAIPMTGSIVLVMLIGWLACICLMILLSSTSSSRRSESLTHRATGGPVSSTAPYTDSSDH